MPLYRNMRVNITQNRNKKKGILNAQGATVLYMHNFTIFLKLINSKIVAIHLVTEIENEGNRTTKYPIVPAYACTICKVQGQNLKQIIFWLDSKFVSAGTTYVTLSRIRKLDDLLFLIRTDSEQYKPVEMLDE